LDIWKHVRKSSKFQVVKWNPILPRLACLLRNCKDIRQISGIPGCKKW
jgi:hypothetical protein